MVWRTVASAARCTLRDDLLTETLRLLGRPDRPDYIVVEASGVSNPKWIAETFLSSEFEFEFAARLDSIVAVVDTDQLLELRGKDLALALDQIRVADIVVLNKADLVSREQLDRVRTRVAELAHEADRAHDDGAASADVRSRR